MRRRGGFGTGTLQVGVSYSSPGGCGSNIGRAEHKEKSRLFVAVRLEGRHENRRRGGTHSRNGVKWREEPRLPTKEENHEDGYGRRESRPYPFT